MIPITRKELYLNKIVGNNDYETPEKPITEEEFFFAEILGEAVQAPEPLTRYQIYLAKIAGRNIEIPYPETRLEYFLARAAGMDVETPTPITREEIFWSNYSAIVEVEGVPPLTYKVIEGTLENYRIYGNTVDGESVGDKTGNLFDKNDPDILDDCEIQGTNIVVRQKYFVTNFISVNAETSYITNRPDMNGFSSGVLEYDSSKQLIRRNPNSSFDGFTTTNTTAYIKLNGKIEHKDTCMLVKGNTAPSIYEPYGYKVPVTVEGKNLFDMKKFAETASPTNATVKYSENSLIFTPKAVDAYVNWVYSQGTVPPDELRPSCIDVLPSTTYTISMSSTPKCYISWLNNFYNAVSAYTRIPINQSSYTFTTPSNCTKLLIRLGKEVNNIGDKFTISNIMLNEGSTALPYEPYHAPITTPIYLPEPLRMVGEETEYVDYEEQKQHRVRKNLLRNTVESQINNGVTFTVNDDGGVTCNGTSTSRYYSLFRIPCYLVAGEYIISGCPVGGDSGTYRADIRISPNGTMISGYDIGVGATIVIDESGWYDYTIRIQGGYTVDNITFKPMIRKGNIEDDTYEPYIENTELDVTLPELPTLAGTNVLTVGTAVQPSKVYIKGEKGRE